MMGIELRRQPAQHLLITLGIVVGFGELRLALEIGDASVFADRSARGFEFREGRGQRLDAQAGPTHGALEEQRVGEFFAVIGAYIDKDAAPLPPEKILEKKAVLADLGIELH